MTKMRIYEYAKQQGIPNKKVIETLKELNIDVKNHMSTISTEEQQQLNQHFQLEGTSKSQQKNRKKNQIIKIRINLQNQSSIQKINNRKRIRNNTMLKILDRGKSSKITQIRKDK